LSGKKNIKKSMAQALDVPIDVALDQVKIVITGNSILNAENHKGIQEYSESKISFQTSLGLVEIRGKGLILAALTGEELQIEGELESIIMPTEEKE